MILKVFELYFYSRIWFHYVSLATRDYIFSNNTRDLCYSTRYAIEEAMNARTAIIMSYGTFIAVLICAYLSA